MGFFSRLFKFREQDSSSPETTWAYEGNASELVLDPEAAATLLTEFDIDTVIASHEEWKERLLRVLQGRSDEDMVLQNVSDHGCCMLGQWLEGQGKEMLGHYPAFQLLVTRHHHFHTQAALVVKLAQDGELEQAVHLFQGGYRHASNQVVLLLKELRRSLGK